MDLPALARASAGLAECVAGIRLHGTGRVIRMSPDGRQAPTPPPPPSTATPITLPDPPGEGPHSATWASSWPPPSTRPGFPQAYARASAASNVPTSLAWARTALRFTTARQPVVHYDDLGALALLA